LSNLSTKISTFKIIELSIENPPPIEVDLLTVIIPKRQTDDDNYAVFLKSNDRYESDSWTCGNQLYIPFSFQVNDSLNSLT